MNIALILLPITLIIWYLFNKSFIEGFIKEHSKKNAWFKVFFRLIYYFLVLILSLYIYTIFFVVINNVFWYINLVWILLLPLAGLVISYLRFKRKLNKLYLIYDAIALTNLIIVFSVIGSQYFESWVKSIFDINLPWIYIVIFIIVPVSQYLSYRLKWLLFLFITFVILYIFTLFKLFMEIYW